MATDKFQINTITNQFFNIFSNTNRQQPDWAMLYKICIVQTMIIKKTGITETIYNLDNFIEPRKTILTNGTLTHFEEREIDEETKICSHIAQRFSKYQKTGNLNGVPFVENGIKLFQFIKTANGWKINSLLWED